MTLRIAVDSLRSLPTGASYSGHSGQARVDVSRKASSSGQPEQIVVYASCDSLQLLCEEYEHTVTNLKKQLILTALRGTEHEAETRQERPPNAAGRILKAFLIGLLAGIISTLLFILKIKK